MQIGEDISWTVHTNWSDEKLLQIEAQVYDLIRRILLNRVGSNRAITFLYSDTKFFSFVTFCLVAIFSCEDKELLYCVTNFKDTFLVPDFMSGVIIFYLGSKFPSQSRDLRLRARRRELDVINGSASSFSPSSSNNVSGETLLQEGDGQKHFGHDLQAHVSEAQT